MSLSSPYRRQSRDGHLPGWIPEYLPMNYWCHFAVRVRSQMNVPANVTPPDVGPLSSHRHEHPSPRLLFVVVIIPIGTATADGTLPKRIRRIHLAVVFVLGEIDQVMAKLRVRIPAPNSPRRARPAVLIKLWVSSHLSNPPSVHPVPSSASHSANGTVPS
jgi:hypothetical protein